MDDWFAVGLGVLVYIALVAILVLRVAHPHG